MNTTNTTDMMDRYHEIQAGIMERMTTPDTAAKEAGKLEGRYIREEIADGFAYYKITEERPRTIVVEHMDIGDGWTIPFVEALKLTIPKKYVIANIEKRDNMDELFNRNKGAA